MLNSSDSYFDVSQLVGRFWTALDHRNYAEILPLITPDCRWQRDGEWKVGQDEILAALEGRPAQLFTRHHPSNLVVDSHGDALSCRHYLAVYASFADGSTAPRLAEAPAMIAEVQVSCVRYDGVLKISSISSDVNFMRKPSGA